MESISCVSIGADDGIRTRDLRFTKPLLYQLSYVGAKRAKITSGDCAGKRKIANYGNLVDQARKRDGIRISAH